MINIKELYYNRGVESISSINLYLYTAFFSLLGIIAIFFSHTFNLAGPAFLPMHFFIFVAALSFGWRAGLLVGIFLPIISYFTSGMPLLNILPRIILEVAAYGFLAGFFKEVLRLNSWLSLIIAMFLGRIISGFFILFFTDLNIFQHIFNITKIGLPGMLIQLIFIIPLSNLFIKWKKL